MTGTDDWDVLVDENLEPQIASYVENEEVEAAYGRDALFPGADDEDDVLPYARRQDWLVLTSDLKDFRELPADEHEGVLVLFDEKRSAHEIAAAVLDVIAAYSDRDELRGYEYVDRWF